MRYPAVFIYEPDQEIAVIFPDFDVATSGVDEADALESAKELLELTLFGFREDGKLLPELSRLSDLAAKENERVVMASVAENAAESTYAYRYEMPVQSKTRER